MRRIVANFIRILEVKRVTDYFFSCFLINWYRHVTALLKYVLIVRYGGYIARNMRLYIMFCQIKSIHTICFSLTSTSSHVQNNGCSLLKPLISFYFSQFGPKYVIFSLTYTRDINMTKTVRICIVHAFQCYIHEEFMSLNETKIIIWK